MSLITKNIVLLFIQYYSVKCDLPHLRPCTLKLLLVPFSSFCVCIPWVSELLSLNKTCGFLKAPSIRKLRTWALGAWGEGCGASHRGPNSHWVDIIYDNCMYILYHRRNSARAWKPLSLTEQTQTNNNLNK